MQLLSLLSVAGLATTAYSHGLITSPASRTPGAATAAACGQLVVDGINADNTSYVEALTGPASRDTGYNKDLCNLYLCKGMQFGDNPENAHEWTVGQKVDIEVWLRIPHFGYANVSIVDTKTNTYVKGGEQLIYWDAYADEKIKPNYPANQTAFSVTVPDLGGACATAGECVLQWWWLGTAAKQTYESCLDFTIVEPAKPAPKKHGRPRYWWKKKTTST